MIQPKTSPPRLKYSIINLPTYVGNDIEYGVKPYQVKTTIGNCMDILLKGLKILTSHIIDVLLTCTYVWLERLKVLSSHRIDV